MTEQEYIYARDLSNVMPVEMTAAELRDKMAREGWDADFVKAVSPKLLLPPNE